MSISLYDASVGIFVPYLGNLSGLLDHASAYAKARNIDPAILLNMRLYPNMYNLTRQVGEANRHAVVACALLAGNPSPTDPEIREALEGNICMCTGYQHIVEAIRRAAQLMKEGHPKHAEA